MKVTLWYFQDGHYMSGDPCDTLAEAIETGARHLERTMQRKEPTAHVYAHVCDLLRTIHVTDAGNEPNQNAIDIKDAVLAFYAVKQTFHVKTE